MKKMRLSKSEKKYLIVRFIILLVVFWFLGVPISMGHTSILEYPSQMSSRITNFQVLDFKPNETDYLFVVDYQVYNSGPFIAYCGRTGGGGSADLHLPFSFSSSNVNLENISIGNLAKGTLMGDVVRIKPGIHNYTSIYLLYDSNQRDYNFSLQDGDYFFRLGKTSWNQVYGINFTITGENYIVDYEIPIEPWDSNVLNLGDPFLMICGLIFFSILVGPIIYKHLKKQPDQLEESKLQPDPNI